MNIKKNFYLTVLRFSVLASYVCFCNVFGAASSLKPICDTSVYINNTEQQSIGNLIEIINSTQLPLFASVRSGGLVLFGLRQKKPFEQLYADPIMPSDLASLAEIESKKFQTFSARFWTLQDACSLDTYYSKELVCKSTGFCLDPIDITGLRRIFIIIEKTPKGDCLAVVLEYDFTTSPACEICKNRFGSDEQILILGCGHKMHTGPKLCAMSVDKHDICPICKKLIMDCTIKSSISSEKKVLSLIRNLTD